MLEVMAKKRKASADTEQPQDDWVARTIRMPKEIYERVIADAEANRRSVNLHILWLIEKALDQQQAK